MSTPVSPMLDWMGHTFAIAALADVPWPTSSGGNARGVCPLDDYTLAFHAKYQSDPETRGVQAALAERAEEVRQCWHHRRPMEERQYIAELTCFFVENDLQPYDDAVMAVVARDGRPHDLAAEVSHLFAVPMRWSFQPDTPLSNGRHRLCAFKEANVERVAMQLI